MKRLARTTYRNLIIALIALAAVGVLVLAIGWFYVLKLSSDNSRLQTETDYTYKQSAKLAEISYTLKKVLTQKAVLYEVIPSNKDVSSFMADVENVAKSNGLSITSAQVGSAQTKTAKGSDFSQTVTKQDYYELSIKYAMSGKYSNFTNLINNLSALRRLNKVTDVTIVSTANDAATAGNVNGTFVVTIYAKK